MTKISDMTPDELISLFRQTIREEAKKAANEVPTSRLENTVKEAAKEAVNEVLTALGFDINHPQEACKDQFFVRSWRKSMDKFYSRVGAGVTSILIIAVMGAIWIGIKMSISK